MTPDHKRGIIPTEISPVAARVLVVGFLVVLFGVPWLMREWVRLPRALTGAELRAYEDALADASRPRAWVQPRLQYAASIWGGFGNSKAVVGRDGWLFYKPDLELFTNPPTNNPLPAIRDFERQLAARGIRLVVFVAPAKNPANQHEYLKTDTHWLPDTMERTARALAKQLADLPTMDAPDYNEREVNVTNAGDLAVMLGVPYPKETVTIRQVRHGDRLWESSDEADVLLLGDSFANIYSGSELKWGRVAGLAERLSFHLKRPLDVLIRNDAGAYATRLMLAQQPERLKGKRVVIWEFAARELAIGDWKRLPVP